MAQGVSDTILPTQHLTGTLSHFQHRLPVVIISFCNAKVAPGAETLQELGTIIRQLHDLDL